MSNAFIFPGQGSQKIGMGKDLYDSFVEAREVFEEVDDALSLKLSHIIINGDDEELKLTVNTQPALMCMSFARPILAACKMLSTLQSIICWWSSTISLACCLN